jgi:serine/threonine protein kinase
MLTHILVAFVCFLPCTAPPPNYSVLPALERIHRFVITGTLQQSLFGVVKLAFDRLTKRQVAIKISRRDLSQASQARSGVTVLENVKREAQVLRYMAEHRTQSACQKNKPAGSPPMKLPSVPNISDGFSQMDISDNPNGVPSTSGSNSPTHRLSIDGVDESVKVDTDGEMLLGSTADAASEEVCEGATYICDIIDELEDEFFHYVITEFVPGGDLYSILTTFPQHRLTESQARFVFRQVVLGVKHLHDNHIAHLDLSLENICLDASERCRIIDFGVAALHPLTPSSASSSNFFSLSNASPIATIPFNKPIVAGQTILQSFMCKPIAHLYNKPGKIRYMSPVSRHNRPQHHKLGQLRSPSRVLTVAPPFLIVCLHRSCLAIKRGMRIKTTFFPSVSSSIPSSPVGRPFNTPIRVIFGSTS